MSVTDQLGDVQPHVRTVAELLAERFGLTTMGGHRETNTRDRTGHPAGLALDLPATKAVGDSIAAFLTTNAEALGVKYVIWQQRIWYPAKGWAAMEHRTGAGDQNHLRHVHVSFNATAPDAGLLGNLRAGVENLAGGLRDINPLSGLATWPDQALGVGLKLAAVGAGLALVVLGVNRMVVPAVQGTVNKVLEAAT